MAQNEYLILLCKSWCPIFEDDIGAVDDEYDSEKYLVPSFLLQDWYDTVRAPCGVSGNMMHKKRHICVRLVTKQCASILFFLVTNDFTFTSQGEFTLILLNLSVHGVLPNGG